MIIEQLALDHVLEGWRGIYVAGGNLHLWYQDMVIQPILTWRFIFTLLQDQQSICVQVSDVEARETLIERCM